MANAYSSHKTSYVWVSCDHCVQGFELDEINYYIDSYNKSNDRYYMNFWEWLHFYYGFNAHAFNYLWNEGNPLMSKVHRIKSRLKGE